MMTSDQIIELSLEIARLEKRAYERGFEDGRRQTGEIPAELNNKRFAENI